VMCLRNCSCKAVVFRYHSDPAMGDCYLPPDIFSLKDSDNSGYHSVYLKVQNAPHAVPQGMKRRTGENIRIQHWILLRSTFLNWNFGAASSKKRKCL